MDLVPFPLIPAAEKSIGREEQWIYANGLVLFARNEDHCGRVDLRCHLSQQGFHECPGINSRDWRINSSMICEKGMLNQESGFI